MSIELSTIGKLRKVGFRKRVFSTTDGATTPSKTQLFPLYIDEPCRSLSIFGTIVATQAGKLFEVAVYGENREKILSSGPQEIPVNGEWRVNLSDFSLPCGKYFVAISHNATTGTFATSTTGAHVSTNLAIPLPATISTAFTQETSGGISFSVSYGDQYILDGLSYSELANYRVLGANGSQPWAWNTVAGKLAYSVDNGITYTDLMPLPSSTILNGGSPIDLIVYSSMVYLLLSNGRIARSSTLLADATWEDISCPISDELLRASAVFRPYGFSVFSGYVFLGEYSTAANELAGGPRILKMDVSTKAWTVSKQFANARHIHSFTAVGSIALYVSIGDLNWGDDVGIHRIVPAGFGSPDSWVKWTNINAPFLQSYPVDFVFQNGVSGVPDGLYGAADIAGSHVLHCKISGAPGQFNMGTKIFRPVANSASETVRSIVADTVGRLFYWTAETSSQALYMALPPYNFAVKLVDYSTEPQLYLARAVISGGYLLMYKKRIKLPMAIRADGVV